MTSRVEEAKSVARSLLDDLELANNAVGSILMKARRLARLMRDSDAQAWLELEASGYPDKFDFSSLGTCRRYAQTSLRVEADGKYWTASLPEMEAYLESDEAILDSIRATPNPSPTAKDHIEKTATQALMTTHLNVQARQRKRHAQNKKLYTSLRSAIHCYVTDTFIAIELGDAVEDIFEATRTRIDAFIASHCPRGAEKLIAINERMVDGTQEGFVAALTSCRRLLVDVADGIFPAQSTPYNDTSGKSRAVGSNEYKNRILAFLDGSSTSRGSVEIIESGLSHLAARLDAIYEKTCKGVHAEVTAQEARLAVINTYLFIGEVANVSSPIQGD